MLPWCIRIANSLSVQSEYIKTIVRGLTIGGLCLGFAGACASVILFTVGYIQNPLIVSATPVVFIAIFLVVTMALLQKDAVAVRRSARKDS
jgi:hypothetical protein